MPCAAWPSSPGATARLGASSAAYWSQLLLVSALFVVLAVVLILLPSQHSAVFWIKAGFLLVSLPLLFRWAHRAWPRRTRLDPEAFRAALP